MSELRLDLLPKVENQRLRRVIVARAAGVKFLEIAKSEGISTERARQLWNNGKRLLDLLARVPSQLDADTLIENALTSVRLRNACNQAGVKTLGELSRLTARELLCIKNCSTKTFREARELLQQAGLCFADDDAAHAAGGE